MAFAQRHHWHMRLAYDPPYHSQDHPRERTWGMLEKHGNGSILDDIETVVKFAQTMTWKGQPPVVQLVTQTYQTGVKRTNPAMAAVATQIQRLPKLVVNDKALNFGKWFVEILYHPKLETE